MKKVYIILVMITAGIFSCADQLNQIPISNPSATNFFRSSNDFIQAVNGVYNALGANAQTGSGYAIRRFELSEIRSDNIYSPGTGVRDWNPVNNFQSTLATNAYMPEAWGSNYLGIARANAVLDNLKTTTVFTDATLKARLEGEAKFLRAFFYFDLVRWFGRVPIIDHVATPNESLNIPRGSVADVYTLIINDLTTAIANLPDSYAANTDKGRATNLAAKSMLGLVYLTRTGPTYGIEGPGMATNEFAQAAQMFNDVIASAKFTFVPTYAAIFSWTNEGNGDIVFDIQAIKTGVGDVGTGARFPTEITDAFFANSPSQGIVFAGGAAETKTVSNDMNNSFEVGDIRKTFGILPSYTYSGGTVNSPMYVKFWDKTQAGADRFNWGLNYPAIRYTDVLMMKAECIIRGGAGGTQADADAIVNQVRTRAGLGAVPLTNTTLAQLLMERRHEFMAEGLRWHDLVRNGTVLTTMNAWRAVDDALQNKIQPIIANYILYPLPQNQLTVKTGLYDQNSGY